MSRITYISDRLKPTLVNGLVTAEVSLQNQHIIQDETISIQLYDYIYYQKQNTVMKYHVQMIFLCYLIFFIRLRLSALVNACILPLPVISSSAGEQYLLIFTRPSAAFQCN